MQRLAFGFALLTVAFLDWQRFRWWWVVVGVAIVVLTWEATGHALLFFLGGM